MPNNSLNSHLPEPKIAITSSSFGQSHVLREELKKSFQNMNSASEKAIAALVKKFPHLKDEFGK